MNARDRPTPLLLVLVHIARIVGAVATVVVRMGYTVSGIVRDECMWAFSSRKRPKKLLNSIKTLFSFFFFKQQL